MRTDSSSTTALPAVEFIPSHYLPRLSAEDRALLKPVATSLLKGVDLAQIVVGRIARDETPTTFWMAMLRTVAASFTLGASGVATLAATAALVVCSDDETAAEAAKGGA